MDNTPDWCEFDRVEKTQNGCRGTVRYYGVVQHSPDGGVYAGVEWDDAREGGGKYDGEIFGERYFTAPKGSSSFLKKNKLRAAEAPLETVLIGRYSTADDHVRRLNEGPGSVAMKKKTLCNVHSTRTVVQAKDGSFPNLKNVTASGLLVSACGDIGRSFPALTDLNLSNTLISRFTEVANLVLALPALETLSLQGNRFEPLTDDVRDAVRQSVAAHGRVSALKQLSFTETNLPPEALAFAVKTLTPQLEELRVANNGYTAADLALLGVDEADEAAVPLPVKRLHLERNDVASWREAACALRGLPQLELLYLSENLALDTVDAGHEACFPSLKGLFLRRTGIKTWECVDEIAKTGVEELALVETPLTDTMTEHERRCLLIARVPTLKVLNRGTVSPNERINSERFAVRHFHGDASPPAVIHTLREKYGELLPLVDVDLAPKKTAGITAVYHTLVTPDTGAPQEAPVMVNLTDTVAHLKKTLCAPFGLKPSELVFTHVDPEVRGTPHEREEMNTADRMLYTYHVKDGDFIEIDKKSDEVPNS